MPSWNLAIQTLLASFGVICAVVCYRLASELRSQARSIRKIPAELESLGLEIQQLDLRIKRVTSRLAMAAAREKLTETSQATEDEPQDKNALKRKLGLVGAGAQRAAFEIHARGGKI